MPLVHLEATPGFAPASGATFYGRLVNNSGSDDREPSDVDIVCGTGGLDCFPIVTQEVTVSSLSLPFDAGVCELD